MCVIRGGIFYGLKIYEFFTKLKIFFLFLKLSWSPKLKFWMCHHIWVISKLKNIGFNKNSIWKIYMGFSPLIIISPLIIVFPPDNTQEPKKNGYFNQKGTVPAKRLTQSTVSLKTVISNILTLCFNFKIPQNLNKYILIKISSLLSTFEISSLSFYLTLVPP